MNHVLYMPCFSCFTDNCQQGMYLEGTYITSYSNVPSHHACMGKCMLIDKCLSAMYHNTEQKCVLMMYNKYTHPENYVASTTRIYCHVRDTGR